MTSTPAVIDKWSLPIIAANGSLEQYISSVNATPMLTHEDELELATRLQENGDLHAAHHLVLSHLRVVVSVARSYAGYGLQQADLIQEGNIGLMKAVKRFEPQRGVRLFSFAIHWIKAEIHEFILRNWRLVRVATTKPQRKLFFNLRSMKSSFSALSENEAREIAEDLGVKPEEVREMEVRMSGHDIALVRDDNDDDGFAPIDWLADRENEPTRQIEKKALDKLHGEGIQNALATLDERSRRIVESRWLSDDSGPTLHDLAAEFGGSAERIRQIEAKALSKMKLALMPAE
jgi:RNA polymerase sigma-32 factor